MSRIGDTAGVPPVRPVRRVRRPAAPGQEPKDERRPVPGEYPPRSGLVDEQA